VYDSHVAEVGGDTSFSELEHTHNAHSPPLVVPDVPHTSDDAKEMMITTCLLRWNYKPEAEHCCKYHAAVAELLRIGMRIKRRPCDPDYTPVRGAQCCKCGTLFDGSLLTDLEEDSWCDVCGGIVGRQSRVSL